MRLNEIQIPSRHVQVGGGKIVLYPLSLNECGQLLDQHGAFIGETILRFADVLGSTDLKHTGPFAAAIIASCPPLVCAMIAYAAREPEAAGIVAMLPAGVQIEALVNVIELTLADHTPLDLALLLRDAVAPVAKILLPTTRH